MKELIGVELAQCWLTQRCSSMDQLVTHQGVKLIISCNYLEHFFFEVSGKGQQPYVHYRTGFRLAFFNIVHFGGKSF